jgi:hypothetical protein
MMREVTDVTDKIAFRNGTGVQRSSLRIAPNSALAIGSGSGTSLRGRQMTGGPCNITV